MTDGAIMKSEEVVDAVGTLVREIVSVLQPEEIQNSNGTRIFFPDGIELLDLKVHVGPAQVDLRIAGAKGLGTGGGSDGRVAPLRGRLRALRRASPADIATAILASDRITLRQNHPSTPPDGATAYDNIVDTAAGRNARRSQPSPAGSGNPPGGDVALDAAMLGGMYAIAANYSFTVNEIAGGKHTGPSGGKPGSRHYAGVAFDVGVIDGVQVSPDHPSYEDFMVKAMTFGATEVLGPGDPDHDDHVHVAWPRPGIFGESEAEEYLG